MRLVKYFLWLLALLLQSNLNAQTNNGFIITGQISGLRDGANVYLVEGKSQRTISKAKVKNDFFYLQGKVPHGTEYYYLKLDSSISKLRSNDLLVVNAPLKLTGELSNWPNLHLIGSEPQQVFLQLVRLWDEVRDQNEDRKNRIDSFIKEHLNSLYIPDLIQKLDREILSFDEKRAYYNDLPQHAKSSYFGQELKRYLERSKIWESIKPGTIIPNFIVMNTSGKKLSIREIVSKNEYTLIDLWASWCGPCRKEFPNMKKVYEAFSSDGFGIVGVSLDKKAVSWRQALKEDQPTWLNCIDFKDTISKIFDIGAIPAFMLVNRKGKLISVQFLSSQVESFGPGLRDDDLYNTVQGLLSRIATVKSHKQTTSKEDQVRALTVGDKMPDLLFDQIINYKTTKARISDFKGKLLILDFWFTGCATCIQQFPHLTELQTKIGSKIQIMPVGFETYQKGEIKQFVEKRKGTLKEMKLPTAVVDAIEHKPLLIELFPGSNTMPTEIWIDPDGMIIGITGHQAVTEKNIRDLLDGKHLNFSLKRKQLFVSELSEFLLKKGQDNNHVYGSAFCGYVDTLNGTQFVPQIDSTSIRYFGANSTVFGYYIECYQKFFKSIKNGGWKKRIYVESDNKPFYKDYNESENLDNWAYDDFAKKNLFCFEIRLPSSYSMDEFHQRMALELDSFFKIKSSIEKRKVKCLALVVSDFSKIIKSNSSNQKDEVDKEMNYFIQGINTDRLITTLINNRNIPFFITNETNIIYPIDITIPIPADEKELSVILPFLNKYGFDLVEVERDLDMLILKNLR